MNPSASFWQFRISMFFVLCFMAVFLPLIQSKKKIAAGLVVCYGITALMDYLYFVVGGGNGNPLIFTLTEIVAVQAVPLTISRYHDFRAVFVGFTAAVYVLTGNIVSTTLLLTGVPFAVNFICQCLIHIVILFILAWYIREPFMEYLTNRDLPWGEMCVIPAMFYTAIYACSMWPANIYRQPENILGVTVILLLMVVVYIMIIKVFTTMKQQGENERRLESLEQYAKRLKIETDSLQEKEMEAAVLRHDLRHFSILINSYLEEGNEEKIRELLDELNERAALTKPVRYCENLALNGIIARHAALAKELGLRFKVEAEIPREMSINEFEFATVASNLLENAVNAARDAQDRMLRFVEMTACCAGSQILLTIKNGCETEPEISQKTGLPISEGGAGHGYGVRSVRAFVEKYGAVFDFEVKNQIFLAKLLIPVKTKPRAAP